MPSLYIDEMECNVINKAIKIVLEKNPVHWIWLRADSYKGLFSLLKRVFEECHGRTVQTSHMLAGGGDGVKSIKCPSCTLVVIIKQENVKFGGGSMWGIRGLQLSSLWKGLLNRNLEEMNQQAVSTGDIESRHPEHGGTGTGQDQP